MKANERRNTFSSGRQFYDDGYSKEEQELADLPTTSVRQSTSTTASTTRSSTLSSFDGGGGAEASSESLNQEEFFGRTAELKQLHRLRERIMMMGGSDGSSSSNNNSKKSPSFSNQKTAIDGSGKERYHHHHHESAQESDSTNPTTRTTHQDQTGTGTSSNAKPCSKNNPEEEILPAVLVWGTSGTGKSRMIEHFLHNFCCTCGGIARDAAATGANHDSNTNQHDHPSSPSAASSSSSCSCCYILRGKFDEYTGSSDPFSAIVEALNDFTNQLKHVPSEELLRLQRCIKNAFGGTSKKRLSCTKQEDNHGESEERIVTKGTLEVNDNDSAASAMSILVGVVPSLSILAPKTIKRDSSRAFPPSSDSSVKTSSSFSSRHNILPNAPQLSENGSKATATNSWNRLRHIFIQFMKAISTPERPVYIFLDDLQWSSSVSLELLANLISVHDLANFMMLGAIRQEIDPHNNEVIELPPDAPLRVSFLDRLMPASSSSTVGNHGEPKRNNNACTTTTTSPLAQIKIGNLSLSEMTHWLSHLLEREEDDDDFRHFVSKLHAKTHGNVYFTLQSIEELKRKNVLIFSRISFQWEWNFRAYKNDDTDRSHTSDSNSDLPISDDIVTAIESQLKMLPDDIQHVLSVAAYIRATFDLHVLLRVLQNEEQHGDPLRSFNEEEVARNQSSTVPTTKWTMDKLARVVDEAVGERLLAIGLKTNQYRFAHDRIQQAAAYGLVPFGEQRDKLRLRIGHCLLEMYRENQERHDVPDLSPINASSSRHNRSIRFGADDGGGPLLTSESTQNQSLPVRLVCNVEREQDDDGLLFVAADHLNSAPCKDHLFSVELNLQVGEKAMQMAALASASMHLLKATNAMRRVRNPWVEHYDLSLRLYSLRSEVELSLGHYQIGYDIGNQVIDKARTLDEKLPVYLSMSRALGRESKFDEALALSLEIVRILGVFPQRFYPIHIVRDLRKVKAYLKKYTDDDILNLPFQTEYRSIMTMEFVVEVGARANMAGDYITWLVQMLKGACMTFQHGICEESAVIFSALGTFWDAAFNDYEVAVRFANLSHAVLKRTNGRKLAAGVYVMTNHGVYAFSEPLEKCVQSYRKGRTIAMESGEFEQGLLCQQSATITSYLSGQQLKILLEEAENTVRLYRIHRISSFANSAQAYHTFFQELTGQIPIDWNEIEMNANIDLRKDPPCAADAYSLAGRCYNITFLAVIFRKFRMARKLYKNFYVVTHYDRSTVFLTYRALLDGIISSGLYRETGKSKYLKAIRQHIACLQMTVKKKGKNVLFYLLLLQAEMACLKNRTVGAKSVEKMQTAYDQAIQVAQDTHQTQNVALACELFAEHLIRLKEAHAGSTIRLLNDMIRSYLSRSVKCYAVWGCVVKVRDVEQRHLGYLDENNNHGIAA